MHFLKTNTNKIFIGLVLVYLFTRLYHLTILPIFTDESIYIYWAKLIATTHSQWFVSLTDGKPPLLIWMIASFLSILPDSWYLVAGRLPSVVAGLVSLIFIFYIAKMLFKNPFISLLAAFLYIIFPFTFIYDRLALFDSLLQAMLLGATYFAIKFVATKRWLDAVLWGSFLGLAFIAKPTAILFLACLPLVVVILSYGKIRKEWKRIFLSIVLSSGIAEIINNLQRVSSVYDRMAAKNAQFQQPIHELIASPFALTSGNLHGFFNWILGYYTLPFLMIGIGAFIVLLIKKTKIGLSLFLLWFLPVFALATVGREIFPRYMLFTTPYFLIATAAFIYILFLLSKKYWIVIGLLCVMLMEPFLKNDYFLLTNPAKASLPETDYEQLISLHPSGFGLGAVYTYLDNQLAQGKKVTLVTQGTFGLYPYAFNLEYWTAKNLTILPRWPLDALDSEIIEAEQKSDVYILFKEEDRVPANFPVVLVLKSEKPGGKNPLLLTKLRQK